MTKQEIYRDLCIEAGSYEGDYTPEQWWDECSHNMSQPLDEALEGAAQGDVSAVAEARRLCNLPAFC